MAFRRPRRESTFKRREWHGAPPPQAGAPPDHFHSTRQFTPPVGETFELGGRTYRKAQDGSFRRVQES